MEKQKLLNSFEKAGNSLLRMLPVVLGTVILVSLANAFIPKDFFREVFTGSIFLDSFIASGVGSVLAGNPLISYIIGGELLNQGVGLIPVTAFIIAWITVGVIQIPAESSILGKRFAITRNIITFILSIIAGITTYFVLNLFNLPFR